MKEQKLIIRIENGHDCELLEDEINDYLREGWKIADLKVEKVGATTTNTAFTFVLELEITDLGVALTSPYESVREVARRHS